MPRLWNQTSEAHLEEAETAYLHNVLDQHDVTFESFSVPISSDGLFANKKDEKAISSAWVNTAAAPCSRRGVKPVKLFSGLVEVQTLLFRHSSNTEWWHSARSTTSSTTTSPTSTSDESHTSTPSASPLPGVGSGATEPTEVDDVDNNTLEDQIAQISKLEMGLDHTIEAEGPESLLTSTGGLDEGDVLASSDRPLVMCHGFGGSAALFAPTVCEILRRQPQQTIFAIDWLGFGRSSRLNVQFEEVDQVTHFFDAMLEKWRKSLGITSMVLAGHSLGGYFCTSYSRNFPSFVHRLVLISPIGVAEKPDGWLPIYKRAELPLATCLAVRMFCSVWQRGITPLAAVRGCGPLGPYLVGKWVNWRYATLDDATRQHLAAYLFHLNAQPPGAESAITVVLDNDLFSRKPMKEVVHDMLSEGQRVHFFYGSHDWMSTVDAKEVAQVYPKNCTTTIVPESGHMLIFENPKSVAEAVVPLLVT